MRSSEPPPWRLFLHAQGLDGCISSLVITRDPLPSWLSPGTQLGPFPLPLQKQSPSPFLVGQTRPKRTPETLSPSWSLLNAPTSPDPGHRSSGSLSDPGHQFLLLALDIPGRSHTPIHKSFWFQSKSGETQRKPSPSPPCDGHKKQPSAWTNLFEKSSSSTSSHANPTECLLRRVVLPPLHRCNRLQPHKIEEAGFRVYLSLDLFGRVPALQILSPSLPICILSIQRLCLTEECECPETGCN